MSTIHFNQALIRLLYALFIIQWFCAQKSQALVDEDSLYTCTHFANYDLIVDYSKYSW